MKKMNLYYDNLSSLVFPHFPSFQVNKSITQTGPIQSLHCWCWYAVITSVCHRECSSVRDKITVRVVLRKLGELLGHSSIRRGVKWPLF